MSTIEKEMKTMLASEPSKSMITMLRPDSMVTECYKMLRTNMSFMNADDQNNVIMFTSSSSEEGKTTTVCNTAVEFARNGEKTLLIECDLRKARVHELFNITQSPGVTNVIYKGLSLKDAVHKISAVENLDILTAGPLPPSPSEMLSSHKMVTLLEDARGHYDRIIIDAPPVLSVTDAAILSKIVDGVVMVAAHDETKKEAVVQAKKLLDKVDAKVLGVVLTKVDIKKSNYYYGNESYYNTKKKKGLFGRKKVTKTEYMSVSDETTSHK